jgi:type IV secretory pathway VirB2 component (pilin)
MPAILATWKGKIRRIVVVVVVVVMGSQDPISTNNWARWLRACHPKL